jgi:hypothetical protein
MLLLIIDVWFELVLVLRRNSAHGFSLNQQLPVITTHPAATQSICSGAAVSFSVTATGTGLTYHWSVLRNQ